MATRVKTEADTDTPCTKPLILHTVLEKGHPVEKSHKGSAQYSSWKLISNSGVIVTFEGFFFRESLDCSFLTVVDSCNIERF